MFEPEELMARIADLEAQLEVSEMAPPAAEQLIACLEGEIAKRDARIVELKDKAFKRDGRARERDTEILCLRAELAAIKAQGVVMPDNLLSHRVTWRQALVRLIELEDVADPETGRDDKAYWQHELRAFDAMYADLDRLNAAPVQQVSVPDDFVCDSKPLQERSATMMAIVVVSLTTLTCSATKITIAARSCEMTNNTIPNVPRELLENIVSCYDEGDFELGTLAAECHALLSATSPAGVDGLEVVRKACEVANCKYPDMEAMADFKRDVTPSVVIGLLDGIRHAKGIAAINDARANGCAETVQFLRLELSGAQAIIDGLRGEVARLREERDSFQRIGIRQIEHCSQLAGLLREKFPRIDPHHPFPLSEVDHCCEYVLHKDRERLHCAIDAALSAGKESAP